jgi:TIR domain-containing protein
MAGIAISYRREDTGWITGRIFDRLKAHYDKPAQRGSPESSVVFLDYDSTPLGTDFRSHIRKALDSCEIVLAIIGPHWTGDDASGTPRIKQDGDWVRIEIEAALKKGIPVVPVLIDRTPLPTANMLPPEVHDLIYRQATHIDSQVDFNSDIERLFREIDRILGVDTLKTGMAAVGIADAHWSHRLGPKSFLALALASLCALAVISWFAFFASRTGSVDPVYTVYRSPQLAVTLVYPNNILTLDDTERMQSILTLRDHRGNVLVKITRLPLPGTNDPKVARQNEIASLKSMNFTITYMAPEKDSNWTNWYVLSGLGYGGEFYFRRWFLEDSQVSMEFTYPKELTPLFDKLIPKMTQELGISTVAPKVAQ